LPHSQTYTSNLMWQSYASSNSDAKDMTARSITRREGHYGSSGLPFHFAYCQRLWLVHKECLNSFLYPTQARAVLRAMRLSPLDNAYIPAWYYNDTSYEYDVSRSVSTVLFWRMFCAILMCDIHFERGRHEEDCATSIQPRSRPLVVANQVCV